MAFENWDEIRMISILDVCSTLGIPVQQNGRSYWCKLRPEEGHASCKLYFDSANGDSFCDFGNCKNGGDVIKFAAEWLGVDYQAASEQLARSFNIAPLDNTQYFNRNEVGDHEWKKLGVYGDLATKNMDLNLDKYSFEYIRNLSEMYNMPVNQLRKEHSAVYIRDIIRKRAIPTVYQMRNTYYFAVYCCLASQKALTGKFDINNVPHEDMEELKKLCAEVTQGEFILRKALKGTDVRYSYKDYNVLTDLKKIYCGDISFEIGEKTYVDVKKESWRYGADLQYRSISVDDYLALDAFGINSILHAAYLRKDRVNLVFLPEQGPLIEKCIEQFEDYKDKRDRLAALQDVVAIEYKGIVFDNWVVSEKGEPCGYLCPDCAEKNKEILEELEVCEDGFGICAVKDCENIVEEKGHIYRVVFSPELIHPLNERQVAERQAEVLREEDKVQSSGVKSFEVRQEAAR